MTSDSDTLKNEVRAFSSRRFAETTRAVYKSQLLAYLRFCIFFGHEPVPAEQSTVLSYTAFLARSLRSSSIQNYLNLVRIIHLECGFRNPLADNYELTNLKKGIARQNGTPPKQMLPFTCDMLLDVKRHLCFLYPSDVAFWAAVCVLRISKEVHTLTDLAGHPGRCLLAQKRFGFPKFLLIQVIHPSYKNDTE